ncbi:MAG: hypothetical protein ACYC8T_11640 [Myxococcaceae bacterium]
MAISMIFIIPTFMYALFLDDLLRYSLDLQEAVLSTPWDFTALDYNKGVSADTVADHAKKMHCDHESGLEGYEGSGVDCNADDHHTSIVAHVCWLNGNAQQVACTGPSSGVGASDDSLWGDYRGAHQPGSGMYECTGREVVENYLLPKTFMAEFSSISDGTMSKENWADGRGDSTGAGSDIHGNAQAGTADNAYFLAWEKFAIVGDPWALNTDQTSTPESSSGLLFDRMSTVFEENTKYSGYQSDASDFVDAVKDELLGSSAPGSGEVTDPKMSVTTSMPPSQSIPQEMGSSSYFNVPWMDWDNDEYQQTYEDRGEYYMGAKAAEDG